MCIQGPPKVPSLPMCLGNELELWKTVKHAFNEFEEDLFWSKKFDPGRRVWNLLGGNIKICNEKVRLVANLCKSLFKTSILMKKH